MTIFFKRIIILFFCLTLLGACTHSKKEAVKTTEKTIVTVFKHKQEPANAKTTYFTYHKPANLKISQNGDHNIIFQDNDKNVYILFVNQKENKKSELNYQSIKKQMQAGDVLKSFHVDDTFIYVYVKPIKDEDVELVVAEGGVKMSTKTTWNQLSDEAKMMTQVIHSVKIDTKKAG